MKKILVALLSLVAVFCCTFALSACDGFGGDNSQGTTQTPPDTVRLQA